MPRRTTPLLTEALDAFLAIREVQTAPTTFANDRALLRKFVREIGVRQVHQLEPEHLETWFAQEARRQAPSSYNKVRTRVRNFLGFCTRRGWLTSDPLGEVTPRPVPAKDRLRLSVEQMIRLIETTENPRDRGVLATACNTGLRAAT